MGALLHAARAPMLGSLSPWHEEIRSEHGRQPDSLETHPTGALITAASGGRQETEVGWSETLAEELLALMEPSPKNDGEGRQSRTRALRVTQAKSNRRTARELAYQRGKYLR